MKENDDKLLARLYQFHVVKPEDQLAQLKLDQLVLEELEILRALHVIQQRLDAIYSIHGIYGDVNKPEPLARRTADEEVNI